MSSAFFCLEGIDGCGKSTQISLIKKSLEEDGFRVLVVREPGATLLGEKIRDLLLDTQYKPSPIAELLLFNAARAQLVNEVIKPELLHPNTIVIADRFAGSTLAYQGYGRGGDLEQIEGILEVSVGAYWPMCSYLLDISLEESIRRCQSRGVGDRFENEGFQFKAAVYQGYQILSERKNWKKISGDLDPLAICQKIVADIKIRMLDEREV